MILQAANSKLALETFVHGTRGYTVQCMSLGLIWSLAPIHGNGPIIEKLIVYSTVSLDLALSAQVTLAYVYRVPGRPFIEEIS